MIEGEIDGMHTVLFEGPEIFEYTGQYKLSDRLSGFLMIGFMEDQAILQARDGSLYMVPFVPMVGSFAELAGFTLEKLQNDIRPLSHGDPRAGNVLHFINPLCMGGDPADEGNAQRLPFGKAHQEVVEFWAGIYSRMQSEL